MRLLECNDAGECSLTDDLVGDDNIPPYAILSHTWNHGQEVTFKDLLDGTGQSKTGYEKIQFCGKQANREGLRYVWVDTCCIDKSNNVELQEAINSMFRWYQNATVCYVYLSDVSATKRKPNDNFSDFTWEPAFQKSRWFLRGWTFQELLAPRVVKFFSREGKLLGDKGTLERQIHGITGIATPALQGTPLSEFSVEERLSWARSRQTTRKEDKAYSLLGVFGIYMTLLYGEGEENAFKRLRRKIDKPKSLQQLAPVALEKDDKECIRHLRLTDPRDDKKRIEETKDGLLEDSYRWVLENPDFKRWHSDKDSRLLWIKGDPGKGKTMLLCGIVNELKNLSSKTEPLSYFFCQATDSRINNATAVLRGLIYLLIDQHPLLISHLRKKYDYAGKTLFEDRNTWAALTEIFTNILQDPSLNNTYLIIDALDECTTDLTKLLDFIVLNSSISSRVKWIVSSRNWPDIEERLERAEQKLTLSLELNAEFVSTGVTMFIQHKARQLEEQKKYDDKTKRAVLRYLLLNSNSTFLWVALVCQNLEQIPRWNTLARLNDFPPRLEPLYERMVQQIYSQEHSDLCKKILALIATVYQPITLMELTSLIEVLEGMADDPVSLREIISFCGSFLTVRGSTIYFVHQSAKDYLLANASEEIFPSGKRDTHYEIFSRSLVILSRTLRRDMYGLHAPGYPIEMVEQRETNQLTPSRYSCIYWVDHLCDWNSIPSASGVVDLRDKDAISEFISKKYLYWLEALSLHGSMSQGVVSMAKLEALIQGRTEASAIIELLRDARRVILYHKHAIEKAPLQAYASALIFSPTHSAIRRIFKDEEPKWVTIYPPTRDKWSACLQTLEGHNGPVNSVAFSHDSARLASASSDGSIKIWDAISGECLQSLESHNCPVYSVAFSPDSAWLASAADDGTVKIWNTQSKIVKCLQTLRGHSDSVYSVAFSHNSAWLASASNDHIVKIWDIRKSGDQCVQTLQGHCSLINSVTFSHDSARLASASGDGTVKIWDMINGDCLQTLESHSRSIYSVAFSPDSARLTSASDEGTITIWDIQVESGKRKQTLQGHGRSVNSIIFSHDSARLASASSDGSVKVWDVQRGSSKCLQTLQGHSGSVNSVAFSNDSARLASASDDGTVKIWDVEEKSVECMPTLEGHTGSVNSVAFSPDSAHLVSTLDDGTAKIWDTRSGECLQTFENHRRSADSVTFSPDSTRLASATDGGTVKIWDTRSGEPALTLQGHSHLVNSVTFSHNSVQLASASDDGTVRVWDVRNGDCLQTLNDHSRPVYLVAFSSDSARLASASDDGTVKIWEMEPRSDKCLQTFRGHSRLVKSITFSHDSTRVATASSDSTVKVWDLRTGECLQTLEDHSDSVNSITFLPGSVWLASASDDGTVKIWDTNIGECLQTLDIYKSLFNISVSTNGLYIHTDIGAIALNATATSNTIQGGTNPQNPQYKGWALSPDGSWITHNSEKKLWLPSEYRPLCSAVSRNMIGIGVGSGKVWIYNFKADKA